MQEQDNGILNNAVQQPPAKEVNPDLAKVDDQEKDTTEETGEADQVMEILDQGMAELSESKDLKSAVKDIIQKLQTFAGDDEKDESDDEEKKESDTVYTPDTLKNV